ncbi:MAG: hypothetical protein QXH78_03090, partial [Desulfurococcaceae archaeon]
LKWFEDLLDKAGRRLKHAGRTLSLSRVLESIVGLGDVVFPRMVRMAEVLAKLIGKLQITMIESMIAASIWYGVILFILITILVFASR